MDNILSFLTSTEIIVVYVVGLIAILLCFIVYLVDKNYDKRKQRHNTKELNKLVEEVQERLEEEKEVEVESTPVVEAPKPVETITPTNEPVMIEPVVEVVPKEEVKEEPEVIEIPEQVTMSLEELKDDEPEILELEEPELKYTNVEPTKEEALNELAAITEELEKASATEEELLEERIRDYEDAQEKDAIISMDELLERTKEMAAVNTAEEYNEETAPISIEEIEKTMSMNQVEAKPSELTETIEKVTSPVIVEELDKKEISDYETSKPLSEVYKRDAAIRFQSTPVISPIFGLENKEITNESIALENTANYEKLDAEIKKTNEFLSTLKELQKKLGE